MTTINLTIDDKKICVPKDTNIFMAAKDNGIYIPGLCYHPKLSQYGGCRLCMVEVTERGRSRHRFSCAQPVSEGMAVKTQTPEINKFTKSVMTFLLAQHPLDCPTCDKSGECGLQDITHDLKLTPGVYDTVRMDEPMRRDNPLLEYNQNRCILCGRCVKVCKEIEGEGAIDYQHRGIKTSIGTAFDKPLDCTFCGGCVSVCPTGSWQDRTLKFRARPWELTQTSTICTYCAVGCTVVLNTKNDKVLRITSDDDLGINEGNLCVKGKFGHEFIQSSRRLKTPLVKKMGILCPTTWEDAIEQVSNKFKEIISEHGGGAIGGIGSEKCTNEDNYVFQKFCRSVLGTNNIDNMANMKAPSLNGLISNAVNNGVASIAPKDIENADTIFFFGTDVREAHPVIGNMARKAIRSKKANLVIANMRNIVFNSVAQNDVRLNYKLGSEVTLVNALMKEIVDNKLVDLKKADSSTTNLKDLRTLLKPTGIKDASKATNVSEDDIKNASALLSKPGNCYIICGKDVEEGPLADDTIKALSNLCTLLNGADNGNASLLFSRSNNNTQGVNDMGVVPGYLPGYLNIDDAANRKNIEKVWNVKLSDDIKKGTDNVVDLASSGKLKALYVMGENPIVSYPDGKKAKEAFEKVDFVVVQDNFLTETAQKADVVFPAATYAEKEGTFTSMGMKVQRLTKIIELVNESKPDWQIISDLANKMGSTYSYSSASDILNEIGSAAPMYAGTNSESLERKSLNWTTILNEKLKPSKPKFEIYEAKPYEVKDKKFPLVLLTGPSLNHQGAYSRNSSSLVAVSPDCLAEVNRNDAKKSGVKNGNKVIIESAQGKIELKAKVTGRVPEGMVFVSEDHEWVHINSLRDKVYTNIKISGE